MALNKVKLSRIKAAEACLKLQFEASKRREACRFFAVGRVEISGHVLPYAPICRLIASAIFWA
jgi:hypothetical protein